MPRSLAMARRARSGAGLVAMVCWPPNRDDGSKVGAPPVLEPFEEYFYNSYFRVGSRPSPGTARCRDMDLDPVVTSSDHQGAR